MRIRKKLAKIMKVKLEDVEGYIVNKEGSAGLEWDFLRNFISGHVNDNQGLATLALTIYGLIFFPQVIGHVEITVIDFVEQVQNHTNPSLAIVAETIRSLNVYRRKSGEHFMGCLPLLYVWLRSHFHCQKSTYVGKAMDSHGWGSSVYAPSED